MRYNIQLPDNKSIRIREMVFSYAMGSDIPPLRDGDCHDVQVTHRALQTLSTTPSVHPVLVDVEDCGAAYRFLMPLLSATPGRWLLTGTPRLLQRPVLHLVNVLRGIGADIERVEDGWSISGKQFRSVEMRHGTSLQFGKTDANTDAGLSLTIDATQSSQMASALVLAAPLLGLRTLHLTTTEIPSLPYLKMTLACTRDWPVSIPGVEVPEIPIGASGDWSAALFWFAYARLHPEKEISLSPLSLNSIQGDRVIVQWFNRLNVDISTKDLSVVLRANALGALPKIVLDVRDCLDTVPVMAALAALLPADITFWNVKNLQFKESDRLHALATQLRPYADIELSDNELRVVGKGCPVDARPVFDTCHDHRLAMAFLLFGPSATLNDTACLRKSYPGLLRDLLLVQRGLAPESQKSDFREETEQ